MPSGQVDRLVVGMADPTTDVNLGLPPHDPPAGCPVCWLRLPLQLADAGVLDAVHAVGILAANVHRFAAEPETEFSDMRLASAPDQRFVPQNSERVRLLDLGGHEEPLPLADVGGVLPAAALLGPDADLTGLDLRRLQRFLRLPDVADRGQFGDGGDKPVALVVAAEEL